MENFSLFDAVYEFVSLFLNSDKLTYEPYIQLVSIVLTTAFFYGLVIRPILWLFGIRGKGRDR